MMSFEQDGPILHGTDIFQEQKTIVASNLLLINITNHPTLATTKEHPNIVVESFTCKNLLLTNIYTTQELIVSVKIYNAS